MFKRRPAEEWGGTTAHMKMYVPYEDGTRMPPRSGVTAPEGPENRSEPPSWSSKAPAQTVSPKEQSAQTGTTNHETSSWAHTQMQREHRKPKNLLENYPE